MTQAYEVPEPILNSPFDEPTRHWFIREGEQPELRAGRCPAIVYPPREERTDRQDPWTFTDGTLKPSADYAPGLELLLVNVIRQRLAEWRNQDYPGVTRTLLVVQGLGRKEK